MKNFAKKHKKLLIFLIILGVIVIGLIIFGIKLHIKNSMAYVQKVEELSQPVEYLSSGSIDANVTNEDSQVIQIEDGKTVSEVYVKVGDKVEPGTKLFSYDTTSLQNEASSEQAYLEAAQKQLDIKKELQSYYEKLTPIPESTPSDADSKADSLDDYDDDASDDNGSDESESGLENREGMTAQEKKDALKKVNEDIKELTQTINTTKIEIESLKQKISDSNVISLVSGKVKSVGDKDKPQNTGTPFLTIGSDTGVVIKGYLNEFKQRDMHVGDMLNVTNYMNGNSTTAKITSISDYPTQNYEMSDQRNLSFYEFRAYIEEADGFNPDDGVSVTPSNGENDTICLENMYVRSDNKGFYCMIRGKDKRLKKVYVDIQRVPSDNCTIIKSGLKSSDYIAFPYGKKAHAGNKTTTKHHFSISEMLGYL